jgi:hypothetical protein
MPRIRQKAEQYAEADFFRELEARKGWNDCQTNRAFSKVIGVCEKTVTNFERDPDSIRLGMFRSITKRLKPDPRIVLKFLGYSDQDIKKIS